MKERKKIIYGILLVISLFVFINGYNLFSDGMFMDGLIYSAIANNLSLDHGTFWDLQFGEVWEVHFREHPPLSMYLESIFHRIFGASFLVERFYSFGIYLVTLFGLYLLWVELKQPKNYFWVPALLYSLIPIVGWSIANNMLENLMSLMCLFSIVFYLKSKVRNKITNLLIMSLFIALAFLTKGVVGLFPFAFPFLWTTIKQKKILPFVIDYSVITLGLISFFGLLFFISPNAYLFITSYLTNQVVGSVENVVTVNSRFEIIFHFLNELILPFVLFTLLIIVLKAQKKSIHFARPNTTIIVFVLISLCGVLPIMISLKQRSFYIVPVFTFITIAISMYIIPFIIKALKDVVLFKNRKNLIIIPPVLAIVLIIIASNSIGRDSSKINDLFIISESIKEKTLISIDKTMFSDWSLRAYFMRNHQVSLSVDKNLNYLLISKDTKFDSLMYKLVPTENLELYKLLEKKN